MVGAFVGFRVDVLVGFLVGTLVGFLVGTLVGFLVGALVGFLVDVDPPHVSQHNLHRLRIALFPCSFMQRGQNVCLQFPLVLQFFHSA